MVKEYTDIWNGFQFRSPTYIDGHFEPYEFDLVKWQDYESPIEVVDLETGERKMSTKGCFSIGTLIWDIDKGWFSFKSVGTRYLEYRIDKLEEWILKFAELKAVELRETVFFKNKIIVIKNI